MLKYFNSFQKCAFRVKILQKYNVDEEKQAYQYFQQYNKLPDGFWKDWHNIIQQAKIRGAMMQRVHLIKVPITSYISFELEFYKKSLDKWEKIFYIPLDECSIKVESDFWIFDDSIVLKMYYDKDGYFLDFEDIKNVGSYLSIKEYLLENKRNIKELF